MICKWENFTIMHFFFIFLAEIKQILSNPIIPKWKILYHGVLWKMFYTMSKEDPSKRKRFSLHFPISDYSCTEFQPQSTQWGENSLAIACMQAWCTNRYFYIIWQNHLCTQFYFWERPVHGSTLDLIWHSLQI